MRLYFFSVFREIEGKKKNMKFKKGRAKTGGRKKGVKNKPNPIKKLLSDFVKDKMEDMDTLWTDLDNREKISLFTSLLKYVIPPAAILEDEDEGNKGEESTVTDTIRQLNEFNNKKTG
jgi:hypothetical protein